MSHSRNTTTGKIFENHVCKDVIPNKDTNLLDLSKDNLYRHMRSNGIDWKKVVSETKKPDKAVFNLKTKVFDVYEIKFQKRGGSADEKIAEGPYFLEYYTKIGKLLGASEVRFHYILSPWFRKKKYSDVLDYITRHGCSYVILDDEEDLKEFHFGWTGKYA